MKWSDPYVRSMALFAVLTAACWFGRMGWDLSYDVNPVTGRSSGPYQPWQVIGCVISLIIVCLFATRWLTFTMTWLVMPFAFTAAWSINAMLLDDQGLWAAGAMLVLIGMGLGTPVIAGPARLAWNKRARSRFADTLRSGLELYRNPPYDP